MGHPRLVVVQDIADGAMPPSWKTMIVHDLRHSRGHAASHKLVSFVANEVAHLRIVGIFLPPLGSQERHYCGMLRVEN